MSVCQRFRSGRILFGKLHTGSSTFEISGWRVSECFIDCERNQILDFTIKERHAFDDISYFSRADECTCNFQCERGAGGGKLRDSLCFAFNHPSTQVLIHSVSSVAGRGWADFITCHAAATWGRIIACVIRIHEEIEYATNNHHRSHAPSGKTPSLTVLSFRWAHYPNCTACKSSSTSSNGRG